MNREEMTKLINDNVEFAPIIDNWSDEELEKFIKEKIAYATVSAALTKDDKAYTCPTRSKSELENLLKLDGVQTQRSLREDLDLFCETPRHKILGVYGQVCSDACKGVGFDEPRKASCLF